MERVSRELTVRLVVVALFPAAVAVAFGLVQSGRHIEFAMNAKPALSVAARLMEHWYDTYAMVGGGVVSGACLLMYAQALSPDARKGGLNRAMLAMAGLAVFFFALYLLGVAGAFRLFLLAGKGFTLYRLIAGICWVLLGYMMLQRLWVMRELVAEVREGRMMISDDASSVGVSR